MNTQESQKYTEDEIEGMAVALARALLKYDTGESGLGLHRAQSIFDSLEKNWTMNQQFTRGNRKTIESEAFSIDHLKLALSVGGPVKKFICSVSSLEMQICKKKSTIIDKRTKQGYAIKYPSSFSCFKTDVLANENHHEICTFANRATLINEIRRHMQSSSMQIIRQSDGNAGKQAGGSGRNGSRGRDGGGRGGGGRGGRRGDVVGGGPTVSYCFTLLTKR